MKQIQSNSRSGYDKMSLNYETTSLLCELAFQVSEKYKQKNRLTQNEIYLSVKAYIRENLKENLRVCDIAQHFGYNEKYLSQMFCNFCGISLKQFTLKLKMEQGNYLLADTNLSVCEIAAKLGYSDVHNNSWRYQVKHNYAMEGAVHQMDILRSLSGANCRKIYCKSWAPEWASFKATAALTLIAEMENGVVCTFTGTCCSASNLNWWNNDRIVAECKDASLVLDHKVLKAYRAVDINSEIVTELPLRQQKVWGNKWLLEQFLDWTEGGKAPSNTLDDNLQLMAMVFSAIESIETGNEIDVQKFLKEAIVS